MSRLHLFFVAVVFGCPIWTLQAYANPFLKDLQSLRGQFDESSSPERIENRYMELAARYSKPEQLGRKYAQLTRSLCESGLHQPGRAEKAIDYGQLAIQYPLDLSTYLQLTIHLGDAMQRSEKPYTRDEIVRVYLDGLRVALDMAVPAERVQPPPSGPSVFSSASSFEERLAANEKTEADRRLAMQLNEAVLLRKTIENHVITLYAGNAHVIETGGTAPTTTELDGLYAIALDTLGTETRALAIVDEVEARAEKVQQARDSYISDGENTNRP